MGYISDVFYMIEFEDAEKLAGFVAMARMEQEEFRYDGISDGMLHPYTFKDALNEPEMRFHPAGNCLIYEADLKWYDSCPEVQAHIALLDYARDQHNAATCFLRIGEDDDDSETDYTDEQEDWVEGHSHIWDVYINRRIDTYNIERSTSVTLEELMEGNNGAKRSNLRAGQTPAE